MPYSAIVGFMLAFVHSALFYHQLQLHLSMQDEVFVSFFSYDVQQRSYNFHSSLPPYYSWLHDDFLVPKPQRTFFQIGTYNRFNRSRHVRGASLFSLPAAPPHVYPMSGKPIWSLLIFDPPPFLVSGDYFVAPKPQSTGYRCFCRLVHTTVITAVGICKRLLFPLFPQLPRTCILSPVNVSLRSPFYVEIKAPIP